MIRPMYVLIDGRATKQFGGVTIATDSVAVEAAHAYLGKILPELNQTRDVIIDSRLGPVRPTCGTSSSPGRAKSRVPTIPRSVSGMPRSLT